MQEKVGRMGGTRTGRGSSAGGRGTVEVTRCNVWRTGAGKMMGVPCCNEETML